MKKHLITALTMMGYRKVPCDLIELWAKPIGFGILTYSASSAELSLDTASSVNGKPLAWDGSPLDDSGRTADIMARIMIIEARMQGYHYEQAHKTYGFASMEQLIDLQLS